MYVTHTLLTNYQPCGWCEIHAECICIVQFAVKKPSFPTVPYNLLLVYLHWKIDLSLCILQFHSTYVNNPIINEQCKTLLLHLQSRVRGILSATFGNWQPIFHFYFYSVAVCRIFVRALFILLWRSIFVSIKTLLLLFESNLDKFTCIVIQKFFLSSLYHIRVQKATCYNCNSL